MRELEYQEENGGDMELILWRHAEAVDGTPDATRALTARGEKQAREVARWLRDRLPKHSRIIASPSVRTRQTADALHLPYETSPLLAPGSGVADLLSAAGWPDGGGKRGGATVLVGHQPGLGHLAALLLSGVEADWTLKKGALWWFTNRVRDDETQTVLRCVMGPDLVG